MNLKRPLFFFSFLQIEIMHEAARYIDQLQNNLVCHIRTHGYPEKMRKEVVAKDRVNNNNSNSGGGGGGFEDSDSIKKNLDSYIASSSKSWPK